MPDDELPQPTDDAVDRLGRAAGAELRRQPPAGAAARIAATARRQRTTRTALLGAGAAAVLVVVGVVALAVRGSGDGARPSATLPPPSPTSEPGRPVEPVTTVPVTSTTATTAPMTSTVAENSTLPAPSSAPATDPGGVAPVTWQQVAAGLDIPWEGARIPMECGAPGDDPQQSDPVRCTDLVVDPAGVPITYDPVSRLVTRRTRVDAAPSFVLPESEGDAMLLAAGPDDVAYFAVNAGEAGSADVLAVSVAADDAGTVLGRFPGGLPGGDADLLVSPAGLVASGWYDTGFRPAADEAPAVAWIDRGDPVVPFESRTFRGAAFDDAASEVSTWFRGWDLGERLVPGGSPAGLGRVVSTFDGGFLALYTEHTDALRAEVMRGYADGTVQHWLLPASWAELGTPILEPQGTILLGTAEGFVRIAPFPAATTGWDGALQIDPDTGGATAPGLEAYLDQYDASLPADGVGTEPWSAGAIGFADALVGPPSSPAELRTVRVTDTEDGATLVEVTTEGHLDDSVFGTRIVAHVRPAAAPGLRADRIDWTNTCQPGRGHQNYASELCT